MKFKFNRNFGKKIKFFPKKILLQKNRKFSQKSKFQKSKIVSKIRLKIIRLKIKILVKNRYSTIEFLIFEILICGKNYFFVAKFRFLTKNLNLTKI